MEQNGLLSVPGSGPTGPSSTHRSCTRSPIGSRVPGRSRTLRTLRGPELAGPGASLCRPREGTIDRPWNSSPSAGARSCGRWSRSTLSPASPSGRSDRGTGGHGRVVVDGAKRARGARSAGPAHASAHVCGPRSDRERVSGVRGAARRGDRRPPGRRDGRRRDRAQRAGGSATVDHRDATRRQPHSSRSSLRRRSSRPRCVTSTFSSCSRGRSSSS